MKWRRRYEPEDRAGCGMGAIGLLVAAAFLAGLIVALSFFPPSDAA